MTSKRQLKSRGAKWCYPTTRWAVYLRDGLACVYCGVTLDHLIEAGGENFLTADHWNPRAAGGTNHPTNLITACYECNVRKNHGTVRSLCEAQGLDYAAVLARSRRRRKRDIEQYRPAAKILLGLTDWADLHQKVKDHDWLVQRQWSSPLEQDYWEYLQRGRQQEIWCGECGALLAGDSEPIPF